MRLPAGWFCPLLIMLGIDLGVPAAPAAPPIDAYGKLPQVELARLSPSGETLAMIAVVGDRRQLVIAAASDHRLLKNVAIGDNKVRDLAWAGDEHLLVMVTAIADLRPDFVHRAELSGVIHVGLNDAQPWAVFQKSDNIEHVVMGYFGSTKVNGRCYGYFGGITRERTRGFTDSGYIREHTFADLYRVDLETGKPEIVARGSEHLDSWMVAADGGIAAYSEYNNEAGDWTLHVADSKRVLVTEHAPMGGIWLAGPGRRTGTVLYTDTTGEADRTVEVDLSTGAAEELFANQSVVYPEFNPVSHLLLGADIRDAPGAFFFDATPQHRFELASRAFPQQRVHLISYSPNLDRMIVETDGPRDSGTYWIVDSDTHHADAIGYSYPTIKPGDVGAIQSIQYHAADGLAIEGILTLPPSSEAKDLPLVVMPHGGPLGISDRIGFDWWAQAFASQGYAVFQPNYRGSSNYGVPFRNAGYGEWGKKMLTDISDGIAELARQRIVDPKRVCVVGASYGGYAAMAGVTLQHGLYRCAVAVAGPSSLASFGLWQQDHYGSKSAAYRHWLRLTGADAGGDHALNEISPAHFASQADAPILLVHGRDDTRVPFDQSQAMASALKSAGKPFEFVELEKEDHFLSREVTRVAMLKAAIQFVQRYNPSGASSQSDAGAAAQRR